MGWTSLASCWESFKGNIKASSRIACHLFSNPHLHDLIINSAWNWAHHSHPACSGKYWNPRNKSRLRKWLMQNNWQLPSKRTKWQRRWTFKDDPELCNVTEKLKSHEAVISLLNCSLSPQGIFQRKQEGTKSLFDFLLKNWPGLWPAWPLAFYTIPNLIFYFLDPQLRPKITQPAAPSMRQKATLGKVFPSHDRGPFFTFLSRRGICSAQYSWTHFMNQ